MRLPGQQRERLFHGFQVSAALIMLHQLAGKAARDGYYLTYFSPADLPEMVAAAAAVSLLASFAAGRLLSRVSPIRVLPAAFLTSGILHLFEWRLLLTQPKVASVAVYLHLFALGALLFSGFWAMLSEEFDPREAKAKIGRITAAGTAGGLAGGILAERATAWFQAESLMPLLAFVHLLCGALLLWVLRESPGRKEASPRARAAAPRAAPVQDVGYLVSLAAMVLIASISASLIDFAFKYTATVRFGKGPDLVRFFALYYTGVSILTLLLQSLASRAVLERVGLGSTMGTLPAVVTGGSLLSIFCPWVQVLSAVRGVETSLRGSLFRAGYEVCFTPVPAAEKRRVKPVIDVGAERLGDLAGSGFVKLIGLPSVWILSAACALGGCALVLARLLDKAYVRALARSLLNRGAELDLSDSFDLTTRTVLSQSDFPALQISRSGSASVGAAPPAAPEADPVLAQLAGLKSPDAAVARSALNTADLGNPLVVAQMLQLLASPGLCAEVLPRLRKAAERFPGFLCDLLRDPTQDFQIRRRIPGLLSGVPEQRCVEGLMAGLGDERFEVRSQCSRALLRLKRANADLRLDQEAILGAVDRELSTGKILREGQQLGGWDSEIQEKDWLDGFLKERMHTGLEHVFTLLALKYSEEALLMALRALHVEDRHLHGTALEYLESVLPEKTHQLLFQVIGEQPAPGRSREAGEILDDLMKTSATVFLRLKGSENPLKNPS